MALIQQIIHAVLVVQPPHPAFASTLLVLTGAIAILRWRNPNLFHSRYKALYIAAHFIAFALVAMQGFLGAIIVYGF